jgi:hypothetical protein
MSLRPHFIKVSDVLVRGVARSTVKREMMRSLRHIAETIDAVMIAEGIEHHEDVTALRDLGLRYGQGYYMARPGPPFPTLPDYVRAELRSAAASPKSQIRPPDDDDDDGDGMDDSVAIPVATNKPVLPAVPRSAFGRSEDEITSDFALPGENRPRPRASDPPQRTEGGAVQPRQPLSDDEATGEALLASLKRHSGENAPEGEPGGGRPGLN